VHDERDRVGVRLVADCVRGPAGERHNVARGGGGPPYRGVRVTDVEGELPAADVVDLARVVPVQHRRSAARWHPDLDREQCTTGLFAGRQHGDLVGAEAEPLRARIIDRYDPDDRRAKLVLPTARGREVVAIAQELAAEVELQVNGILGDDRAGALRDDLEAIRQAFAAR
jgi:hypothetical protein